MSTALAVRPAVEEAKTLTLVPTPASAVPAEVEARFAEPNPLVVVGTAIILAALGAGLFVGTILMWLALRHSGVLAP